MLRSKIKKDPQLLIFMNNAKVRYLAKRDRKPIHTIAAAFPVSQERGEQALYGVAHLQHDVVNPDSDLVFKTDDASIKKLLNVEPNILLEVVIVNDENNPKKALNLAKKLTEGSLLALVGHYTSEVTCEALPEYSMAGLPIVSPLSTLTNMRSRCSDAKGVFFRTSSSSAIEAKTLAEEITKRRKENPNLKVIVFYKKDSGTTETPDIYSENLLKEINEVKLKTNQIPKENIFNINDNNSIDEGKKKIKDADIVLLLPNGKNAGNRQNDTSFNAILNVLKDYELKKGSIFLGSNPLITASLHKEMDIKKLNEKLFVAADWSEDSEDSKDADRKKFIPRYQLLWGGSLNRTTALSYEAAQVLSELIKKGKITRPDIIDGLKNLKHKEVESYVFNDKRGISFDAYGDRVEIKDRILVTPKREGIGFEKRKK